MTLKEFFKKHRCINPSGLGAELWPTVKNPGLKMTKKITESRSGAGKYRITEADTMQAVAVLKKMAADIENISAETSGLRT